MSADWNKEMAKIDKQLESISDEQLFPTRKGAPPATKAQTEEVRGSTSTIGVFLRLVLAVALGVAMLFWPYSARCGVGLFAYLGATAAVVGAGIWASVWTWRHRSGQGHVLSTLLIVWGLVLGAIEVLPRVGYAKPDKSHPAAWVCEK
ncbi:MAG: hypothetical protein M3068_01495 [Gemmatimonadota bacterium]|nr:hypothetical protein [Gemmatimonadota bacterium]